MMKKLTIGVVVAALGLGSLALAKDDKKPADGAAAKAPKADDKAKPAAKADDKAKPADKAAAPAMALPKPAAELDMFKAWAGTWKCDGTMSMQDGSEMKISGSHKLTAAAGGVWYEGVHTINKTKGFPGVLGHGILSYDPAGKKYVLFSVDNWGGWMMVTSTDGMSWSGDMVFMGQKVPFKYTWTKKEGKKLAVEMLGEIGGKKAWDENCTK